MNAHPNAPVDVAVLGARGLVGQALVRRLSGHPWFRLASVTGSSRCEGARYGHAVAWVGEQPLPPEAADLVLESCTPRADIPLVFSALGADVAESVESEFRRAGCLVITNAGSHRMDPDVPLVVPEVNPEHLDVLALPRSSSSAAGRSGAIAANPNCTTIGLALSLAPLAREFGVESVHVVSMQALSGAGLAALEDPDLQGDVVTRIEGEEAKVERELGKIFGRVENAQIVPAPLRVGAQCNRVPVRDGHTLSVSVALAKPASVDDLLGCWRDYRGSAAGLELPSAPQKPVHVLESEPPRPSLHAHAEEGMAIHVGRVRPCPILDFKFVTLSHNLERGAAGGSVLLAELAVARGLLGP